VKTRALLIALGILACLSPVSQAQDKPSEAQALVDDALQDFEKKKYDEALQKLNEAEKLEPNSAFILNLIGAAHTKRQDYTAAKTAFDKSLEKDPSFFPSIFNVGELLFLQKQYPQALEYFARMLGSAPNNELLQFKVVLCLLKTGQKEEAEKLVSRMRYPGEGPAWYYSHAALLNEAGDKRKASEYIASAKQFFPDKISLYSETFSDLGWPTK